MYFREKIHQRCSGFFIFQGFSHFHIYFKVFAKLVNSLIDQFVVFNRRVFCEFLVCVSVRELPLGFMDVVCCVLDDYGATFVSLFNDYVFVFG